MSNSLTIEKSSYPQLGFSESGTGASGTMYENNGRFMATTKSNDDGNYRAVWIDSPEKTSSIASAFMLRNKIDGVTKDYNLFGEHNKPSGNYTGNGVGSSVRTINTGGIGCMVHIYSASAGTTCILGRWGGFCVGESGTVYGIPATEANFNNGAINIKTDNIALNHSDYTYSYEVK